MTTFKYPGSGEDSSNRDWPDWPDGLTVCLMTTQQEFAGWLKGHLAQTGIRLCRSGAAEGIEGLVAEIERLEADVLLLDVSSAEGRLDAVLRALVQYVPDLPVILLWRERSDLDVETVIGCKVVGCQQVDSGPAQHAMAIRAVMAGELWMPRWLEQRMLQHFAAQSPRKFAPVLALTPREQEAHALAAAGMSNKQIARRLSITEDTVKKHLKGIFTKLGIHRRIELVLMDHSTH